MLRTMIVEDNIPFREFLKGALLSQFPSIEVIEAGNGEAFKTLASYPINPIFMDIGLPGQCRASLCFKDKPISIAASGGQ